MSVEEQYLLGVYTPNFLNLDEKSFEGEVILVFF